MHYHDPARLTAAMSTPLRITYLAQHFLPETGALPARVSEMSRRWLERGAEVTVVASMPHRPEGRIRAAYRGRMFSSENIDGVNVLRTWVYARPDHSNPGTILNNASFAALALARLLMDAPPTDVLIASEPPFFPHITGTLVAGARSIPLVLEIRDLWPDYVAEMGLLPKPVQSLLFAVEKLTLRAAEHAVVVTDSFRDRLIEKGCDPERVSVVSNGVDIDFYRPATEPPPIAALRRTDGEQIVGYLGNFGRGQGLEQVVRAAAELSRTGRRVRFVLAGDGPSAQQVRDLAAATEGNVTCVGPIPKSETRAFYNSCDVVLVPHAALKTFADTVPSKLFEVLACARPLVASVSGEAAAILGAAGAGRVAIPGDHGSLAAAIAQELDRPEAEQVRRGEAGRRYVGAHYSRAALADRYLDLLLAVAKGR